MELLSLLKLAVENKASDIFIIAGRPVAFSVNNNIESINDDVMMPNDTEILIKSIYAHARERDFTRIEKLGNDDFSFTVAGVSRFRVSAYMQRSSFAAVVRVISFETPAPKELNIPDTIIKLSEHKKGLVLVTGPAGSGKSTTLACIIDAINSSQTKHIITLEDPLEYLHSHKKSIVSQREISTDVPDYITAIKSALRQRPDVLLIGEMRDLETITIALTAAETGHMVYSSLHTIGAANTIDRILDVFPPEQRYQIGVQLSMMLEAVVSQQLVPTKDGKLVLAYELMTATPAVRTLIRENKIHQLNNAIYASQDSDMIAMDTCLARLYSEGKITAETAMLYATSPETMKKKLGI